MPDFDLRSALPAYRPIDDEDAACLQRFWEFVEREPRCAERCLSAGHLTGSAWLVDPGRTRVLLTFHRKLNRWLQLGGHADGDLNLLRVALREAEEESGIAGIAPLSAAIFDLDIHPIPANPSAPEHLHFDARFVLQAPSDAFAVSTESHALRWIPLDALDTFTKERSLLRMAQKWELFQGNLCRVGR